MAEDKSSFVLYCDLVHTVSKLSDVDAGLLFKHILDYVNDNDPTTDNFIVEIAFEPIKQQLKRDLRRWENIRVKRVEAGQKGGIASGKARSKQTKQVLKSGSKVKQTKQDEANEAVNVNVSVNGNVNDKDLKDSVEMWNFFAEKYGVSKVTTIKGKRKNKLLTRMKEESFNLLEILKKAEKQPFLCGDNKNNWKFTFDWVIENENNYIKILEEQYLRGDNGTHQRLITESKLRSFAESIANDPDLE